MQRHVYYFTHLDLPTAAAAALLSGDPSGWLPAPAEPTAGGWRVTLDADGALPATLARRDAIVTIGGPQPTVGEGLLRTLTWRAASADRWFPVLEAELELAPLHGGRSRLAFTGTYRPPLSVVGGIGETVLGHRVAEACVRRFVLDASQRLGTTLAV